jgi:hypothetical protein
MSLFVCDDCGCVENTALAGPGGYWGRTRLDGKARCSACNPKVGKWHGHFPCEKWDGKRGVVNRPTTEGGER